MYDLIEVIAEIIYLHQAGIYPEEYEIIMGEKQKLWKTDKPWDSQPDIELLEHERDEYRTQAKAVVEYLKKIGLI